ncbi:MAG: hypothetical protein WDN04_06235 [Rhodospirillales bacterium]
MPNSSRVGDCASRATTRTDSVTGTPTRTERDTIASASGNCDSSVRDTFSAE